LLPGSEPNIDGLDISGRSIYCDETGGDYYDFLDIANPGERKICVVVGDVSDHGIPSALLMTTARAFLRQRMSRAGDLSQIVADINRQLVRDVEESGQIIAIGTDGIWETTKPQGQQFGKARFKNVIQRHAAESAAEILNRVINAVDGFAGNSEKSDDVTLVIIKVDVQ
jgi:serine phosphatase RsbU (regulator of sigma subunit)